MRPHFLNSQNRYKNLVVIASLMALITFVSGCTTNPATGDQSFTGFMSPEKEAEVGATEHPKILEQMGGQYNDLQLSKYITKIGKKLAAKSEKPNIPYQFTVLNDDIVNAFALPGGYVYITRGLLALADNEAEIAGVLGHEIGHIVARHTAERYSASVATNLGLTVLGVIGSAYGVPSNIGQVASLGADAALKGYSRDQELEADMLGVRYLARSGYAPTAVTTFFKKMAANTQLENLKANRLNSKQSDIMATHPRTEQRILQAIKLARTATVKNPTIGRLVYLKYINGLVYGDDPSQGIRRGRQFIHPELGIQFSVPPGFTLYNSKTRVIARGSNNKVIMFDKMNTEKAWKTQKLGAYIKNTWGRKLPIGAVENIQINGMEAATAAAQTNSNQGRREIRLLAIRERPSRIYRFAFDVPVAEAGRMGVELRRTSYSFTRLTKQEIKAVRALTIKVITVKPGDTAIKLARAMPVGTYWLELFRVLNGLNENNVLKPGQKVKVVAG